MFMILQLAARNLIQARWRTLLLSAAVGVVTGLLVVLLALGHGIEQNLIRSATALTTGHFNIFGWFKQSSTDAAPIVENAAVVRKIVEEATPGLDYTLIRQRGWGKLVSDTESIQSSLQGISIQDETAFAEKFQLAPQKDYKEGGTDEIKGDLARLAQPNSMALFASQARRLEVDVGDTVTIQTETSSGRTNTLDVTVVAIGKDLGLLSGFVAILPTEDILELYQLKSDTTGAILVYLDDIDKADEAMNTVREKLSEAGYGLMEYEPKPFFFKFESVMGEEWTGQKLDSSLWEDEVVFLTYAITLFNGITWFLTLVLGGIVGMGIMNTMWNAVRERTREIGMMRAVGMTQSRVLFLILLEAILLGLFATTVGAAAGALFCASLNAVGIVLPWEAVRALLLSETLTLAVAPSSVLASIALLTLLTALGAVIPAWRASRLRPITAIQTVE